MGLDILLYVPNIIGYARLLLVAVSWLTYYSHTGISFCFYTTAMLMDCVDGYAARKLKQTSAFGAWFDVMIDNLSRGMLWCRLYNCGFLVVALEWCTFVCTHTLGSTWKTSFVREPWIVTAVMANNFRTPLGGLVILGLHVLPIYLYAHHTGLLAVLYVPLVVQYTALGLLVMGRLVCALVELWCIWSHILYLTSDEANPHLRAASVSATSNTKVHSSAST